MFKQRVYRKGHPLASKDGAIRKSRFVLYEKLKGKSGKCHWCDIELSWKTLCADHLDSNIMNDVPENLVGSCRGCNANREDGTGHGRNKGKLCVHCSKWFKVYHKKQVYCSNDCARNNRPKRGTKALHGTRSRYNYGCRCIKCCNENLRMSRVYYKLKNK